MSPKRLCADTEQRDEPKKALDDAAASTKEARERQRSIPIVDYSELVISAVLAKNTVTESTAAAKKTAARKERECTSVGKYLFDRMARTNDREIDDWYADQDD